MPDGSNSSLPVDVSEEIAATGAIVCPGVETLLAGISDMAKRPARTSSAVQAGAKA
ncbi:MAG TPA: hypothetical protein VKU84_13220 [Stellaceae bacterium]|nr:hypothetical protein [Stellaceae bacterium]